MLIKTCTHGNINDLVIVVFLDIDSRRDKIFVVLLSKFRKDLTVWM